MKIKLQSPEETLRELKEDVQVLREWSPFLCIWPRKVSNCWVFFEKIERGWPNADTFWSEESEEYRLFVVVGKPVYRIPPRPPLYVNKKARDERISTP